MKIAQKTLIRLLWRGRRRWWRKEGAKKWFYYFENLWLIAVISLNAVIFSTSTAAGAVVTAGRCLCWIGSADARTQLNGNEFRIGQVNRSNREKDNCHIIQSNDVLLLCLVSVRWESSYRVWESYAMCWPHRMSRHVVNRLPCTRPANQWSNPIFQCRGETQAESKLDASSIEAVKKRPEQT